MGIKTLKLNVFGRLMLVTREDEAWLAYYVGEGKRRPAYDIVIPAELNEEEIATYLADIYHEQANQQGVRVLK